MDKINFSKKTIIGILAVIASVLLIVLVVILVNKLKIKSYDIQELKDNLISSYEELSLSEMDHVDVLSTFGFEKNEVDDA